MLYFGFCLISSILSSFILERKLNYRRYKAENQQNTRSRYNSLNAHYIYNFLLWALVGFILIKILIPNPYLASFTFLMICLAMARIMIKLHYLNYNAKKHIEGFGEVILSITAGVGILITIVITASILFEALRFFNMISPIDFLFGTKWNPQMAINSDNLEDSFGFLPVILGTILIALIAMAISVPFGIMGAIYMGFYLKPKYRDYVKPILEILAGIPTVVYGYFAVVAIAPFFKGFFASVFGIDIASESALAAGFVMGIMIIPFILSLTDDALNAVPQALKDGATAMGSTKSEMITKVLLPSAIPSIVGAIILAVSRAIGETMIVVMAAGLVAKLTFNPLDSVTTATAQIVTLLVGDQEFDSPKTLSAFALAFTLFVLTFIFNVFALSVIKRYKKKFS